MDEWMIGFEFKENLIIHGTEVKNNMIYRWLKKHHGMRYYALQFLTQSSRRMTDGWIVG
jgi:hypothetical protein